jgi:hypothetical protein
LNHFITKKKEVGKKKKKILYRNNWGAESSSLAFLFVNLFVVHDLIFNESIKVKKIKLQFFYCLYFKLLFILFFALLIIDT